MTVAGELCVIDQLVLRGTRIIIPSKLQPRTLALAHEGHLGVVGTKQTLCVVLTKEILMYNSGIKTI